MRLRFGFAPFVFALLAGLQFAACGGDDTSSASTSGGFASGVGSSTGTSSSGGGAGVGGSGGAGTGVGGAGSQSASASVGSGGPNHAYCGKSCGMDADCCPEGDALCPGPYPHNYACTAGVCVSAHCNVNVDCPQGLECHSVEGFPTCVYSCDMDGDCPAGGVLTCVGQADDATKYCSTEQPQCSAIDDCEGLGTCSAQGYCTCTDSAECTAPGVDTCVMP